MSVQGAATYASYVSSMNIMTEVNISMIDKALDQMELAGEQLAMMIQATAVMPADGSTFDISI